MLGTVVEVAADWCQIARHPSLQKPKSPLWSPWLNRSHTWMYQYYSSCWRTGYCCYGEAIEEEERFLSTAEKLADQTNGNVAKGNACVSEHNGAPGIQRGAANISLAKRSLWLTKIRLHTRWAIQSKWPAHISLNDWRSERTEKNFRSSRSVLSRCWTCRSRQLSREGKAKLFPILRQSCNTSANLESVEM